jgi:hypothetical protein
MVLARHNTQQADKNASYRVDKMLRLPNVFRSKFAEPKKTNDSALEWKQIKLLKKKGFFAESQLLNFCEKRRLIIFL